MKQKQITTGKATIVVNELRIGNLWYYHRTNLVGTVSLISEFVFDCRNEIGSFTPNCKYDPIPLTEEILLKCGAIRVSHKVFKNYFKLHLKRNKYLVISDVETPNLMVGIIECHFENGQIEDAINVHNWDFEKDMHLHQLQNLYFALTGKELEVKL